MPQFDTFIFTHITIYLFLCFVFVLYQNYNYILPRLAIILKFRNKINPRFLAKMKLLFLIFLVM